MDASFPKCRSDWLVGLGIFILSKQPDRIYCHSPFSLALILENPFASTVGSRPSAEQRRAAKAMSPCMDLFGGQKPPGMRSKRCLFPLGTGGTQKNVDKLSRRKTDSIIIKGNYFLAKERMEGPERQRDEENPT